MISYNDLTDFDFQIINTVYQHKSITLSELETLFPMQKALHLRVDFLSTPDRSAPFCGHTFPLPNTAYLEIEYVNEVNEFGLNFSKRTDVIHITDLGIKTIEDWKAHCRQKAKQKWEARAWKFIPIVISVLALIVATTSLAQALHWIDLTL